MLEFLKKHWIAIIATIGLIQPLVIALWKRYYRQGKLEIYNTGNIEISYGPFGPVINIYGTLLALHKNVFVTSMDLKLTREKDKSQRDFRWFAFKASQSAPASKQQPAPEIPYSFMVLPDSPQRYNVVFVDIGQFNTEIRPQFQKYISEWHKVVAKLKEKMPFTEDSDLSPEVLKEIEEFRKTKIRLDTYGLLDRNCYLEPGDYSLNFSIKTSRPNQIFVQDYKFSLNQDQFDQLRLNVITILEEPIANFLKQQNYPYYSAYAEYKK